MSTENFDVVIVGSGFGGSVMAYNLAAAGMKVCLLERGKAYPPGSFPRSPDQMKNAFWQPEKRLLGLYDFWSFKDSDAVTSSGLGGGSLIYANVLLRKDAEWFNGWPLEYNDLVPHYERVEKVLKPVLYPFEKAPYDQTVKTAVLRDAAASVGLPFELVPLAITFGNSPDNPVPGEQLQGVPNLHGVNRYGCRLCGECYMGCNFGSKNTLDLNYLTMASELGVEIRTLAEVKQLQPIDTGYLVTYVSHVSKSTSENFIALSTKYLVLAAGSLGSTSLLLNNKQWFPNLSPALGTKLSGNGDLLTVAIGCREEVDGKLEKRNIMPYYGPVITGAARNDSTDSHGRFYIEDWTYTTIIIWLLETLNAKGLKLRWFKMFNAYLRSLFGIRRNVDLSANVSQFLGVADGCVSSFPMVGMGVDQSDGVMAFDEKTKALNLKMPRKTSAKFFDGVRAKMKQMSDFLNAGLFLDYPSWYLRKTVTVHPLGGCPMGATWDAGVVDTHGEVYNYPNMFIADGSVMPAAIGPNPSLTIAAVADRFSERVVANWQRDNKS